MLLISISSIAVGFVLTIVLWDAGPLVALLAGSLAGSLAGALAAAYIAFNARRIVKADRKMTAFRQQF